MLNKKEVKRFLNQFHQAREIMKQLRKIAPGCFDKNGKAIVAVAAFPKVKGGA